MMSPSVTRFVPIASNYERFALYIFQTLDWYFVWLFSQSSIEILLTGRAYQSLVVESSKVQNC